MAINSPSNIEPLLVTGLFNMTGSVSFGTNIQAPGPQGPGFPKHDPICWQNEMVKLANWQNEQNENVFVDFPILPILLAE